MNINWARVAKPQADGYDLAAIASIEPRWKKKKSKTAVTLCKGAVAVLPDKARNDPAMLPVTVAALTKAWARAQTDFLDKWPAGYNAIRKYLDEFHAFTRPGGGYGRGCSSGHIPLTESGPVHSIHVSINDPAGCAQGIYHEVGHLRLESLGMMLETHDNRLILNGPDELYNSSVRFDKKRPMSAVIHGTYAWLMFTENDYWNYRGGKHDLKNYSLYSFHNLVKIKNGVKEIKKYARATPAGKAFLSGIYDWADDLLARASLIERSPEARLLIQNNAGSPATDKRPAAHKMKKTIKTGTS